MGNQVILLGGAICPVCFEELENLQIDLERPTIAGISGNLVICTACASLVVVRVSKLEGQDDPLNVLVTMAPMTKEEKLALRQDPTAPMMKKCQEELAFTIGGSD